jgi:hypothetical protein
MSEQAYCADLSKGKGMIQETLALLRAWEPNLPLIDFKDRVLREGLISRPTALRVNDIVSRVFGVRLLMDNARPARQIKRLQQLGISDRALNQLLFLQACRGHLILRDFVAELYWGLVSASRKDLTREDSNAFVLRAIDLGRISPPWSESTIVRMARYMCSTLADFGLLAHDRSGSREILPFEPTTLTLLYLAHDLHFSGLGDNAILDHRDWQLFGLDSRDVRIELERVGAGHLMLQHAHNLVTIHWKHPTMEEALDAIAAGQL